MPDIDVDDLVASLIAGTDIGPDELLSAAEATAIAPRRRRGRKPHVCKVYRMFQDGMEFVQDGGTRYVSPRMMARFLAGQTQAMSGLSAPATIPTPTARRRAAEAAGRELERLGA